MAVRAMKNGSRWQEKREEYLTDAGQEMGDDEIVQLWKLRGEVASARGTLLHWHCESLNPRRSFLVRSFSSLRQRYYRNRMRA